MAPVAGRLGGIDDEQFLLLDGTQAFEQFGEFDSAAVFVEEKCVSLFIRAARLSQINNCGLLRAPGQGPDPVVLETAAGYCPGLILIAENAERLRIAGFSPTEE